MVRAAGTVRRPTFAALAPFALVAAIAAPLGAATIKVPSPGITTIQQGVDAAAAGDVVEVAAGTWSGSVTIPGGKDGLTLAGKGKVILDAQPGGVGQGAAIFVQSANVTIRDLTVRHAEALGGNLGDGIRGNPGNGLAVRGVTVEHSQAFGVFVLGANAVVEDCTLTGNQGGVVVLGAGALVTGTRVLDDGLRGILVQGADARVEDCVVEALAGASEGNGVFVIGNDAILSDNLVRGAALDGLRVDGNDATVERNEVQGAAGRGVTVHGDAAEVAQNALIGTGGILADGSFARIEDNQLTGVSQVAIEVVGDDASVSANRIQGALGSGVSTQGADARILDNVLDSVAGFGITVNGDAPDVRRNRVTRVRSGSGIAVGSAMTASFRQNRIEDCSGAALSITSGSFCTVQGNVVRRCGGAAAVDLLIDDSEIFANDVAECTATGLRVAGSGNVLVGNVASNCLKDGIHVAAIGAGNQLIANRAFGNLGEGIENAGTATVVQTSLGQGNRIDFANSGMVAIFQFNLFDVGDESTLPEID